MAYKAVLLDADNTLWHATQTPAEVWQSVLSGLGVPRFTWSLVTFARVSP